MNPLQQFIQSKLSSAIRPPSGPSTVSPQTNPVDRLMGAGSTMQEAQAMNAPRPSLEPMTLTPRPQMIDGAQPSAPRNTGVLDMLYQPNRPSPQGSNRRIAQVGADEINYIADAVRKNTPQGFIDRGELGRSVYQNMDPVTGDASFGQVYRGVMQYLGLDPDDVPNPDFIKSLSKSYNEILEGIHRGGGPQRMA